MYRTGVASDEEVLYIWRNAPTIVIGRNQNPWKECNVREMNLRGVSLARRESGGGAVYQDLGNTNFTFLSKRDNYSVERNFEVIIDALASNFGIAAEVSGRNDLVVDGAKVSGSAFRLGPKCAFHHGTLLLDVELSALSKLLYVNKAKLESKGLKSVRSRVMNLNERFPDIHHAWISEALISSFEKTYRESAEGPVQVDLSIEELSPETVSKLPGLQKTYDLYSDWDWRFGKTPKFTHHLETRFPWGTIDVHVNASKGHINDVTIFSDSLHPEFITKLSSSLREIKYTPESIKSSLDSLSTDCEKEVYADHIKDFSAWFAGEVEKL